MNYTEQDIQTAWDHGAVVAGFKPAAWRKDRYGAWISRQHFDDQNSPFGWEIVPAETAAGANPANADGLKPLQWKNAGLKSNGHPIRPITAYGGVNINLGNF